MKVIEKIDAFSHILTSIKRPEVYCFTREVIKDLPDYFFTAPFTRGVATRVYPSYMYGWKGLYLHTLETISTASHLLELDIWKFPKRYSELAIPVLIAKDGWNYGLFDRGNNVDSMHPELALSMLKRNTLLKGLLPEEEYREILDAVWTHSGEFGGKHLPIPATPFQEFIHLCDHVTFRRNISEDFII